MFLSCKISCYACRSEIHENMNCIRCQNCNDRPESIEEGDGNHLTNINCQSDQETSDIGRFAEISGCLHKLRSSEKQVVRIYSADIASADFILGV